MADLNGACTSFFLSRRCGIMLSEILSHPGGAVGQNMIVYGPARLCNLTVPPPESCRRVLGIWRGIEAFLEGEWMAKAKI
jgi:hypothetical protein